MFNKVNFYVISGGPGSGKTTVLCELERLGFQSAPEVARRIIQEQSAQGGTALPWRNRESYTQLMLERSIQAYLDHLPSSQIIFFDRGIPDTLCYARLIGLSDTRSIEAACEDYRYSRLVFLAPPWEEIYAIDQERKQDYAEAERTYEEMTRAYQECGYDAVVIPRLAPPARAKFIARQVR